MYGRQIAPGPSRRAPAAPVAGRRGPIARARRATMSDSRTTCGDLAWWRSA